jgi:hypothetical protein
MPGEITSYPKKESSSSKHDIFRFFCFSRVFLLFWNQLHKTEIQYAASYLKYPNAWTKYL